MSTLKFFRNNLNVKMSRFGPPIFNFKRLKPVTMTIIASLDIGELNLPAIFLFLPVTDQILPSNLNFQRKQGKIRLPDGLNIPGEILSMRYDGEVRGIVRSDKAYSFSHSIIIDIGTSERIVSVKLSRTIEITGATSYKIANEAASAVLKHVKRCQDNLRYICNHKNIARKVKQKFIENYEQSNIEFDNEKEQKIYSIFKETTRGYAKETLDNFLDFIIDFNRNLYTGSLQLGKLCCEMANILFNLGYPINQLAFANIMNSPPFKCCYNNIKNSSAVNVYYYYTKYDRNTGNPKESKHTIRVNKSGHVRHSGPGLESMEKVYYAFMKRVLENCDRVESAERDKQQIRICGPSKCFSEKEYYDILENKRKLRLQLLAGEIPIANGEDYIDTSITEESVIEIFPEASLQNISKQVTKVTTNIPDRVIEMPLLEFDYKPLSQRS